MPLQSLRLRQLRDAAHSSTDGAASPAVRRSATSDAAARPDLSHASRLVQPPHTSFDPFDDEHILAYVGSALHSTQVTRPLSVECPSAAPSAAAATDSPHHTPHTAATRSACTSAYLAQLQRSMRRMWSRVMSRAHRAEWDEWEGALARRRELTQRPAEESPADAEWCTSSTDSSYAACHSDAKCSHASVSSSLIDRPRCALDAAECPSA
jgi:hypothetical protein